MVGASQNESVADEQEFSKILPAATKCLFKASHCSCLSEILEDSLVTCLGNIEL